MTTVLLAGAWLALAPPAAAAIPPELHGVALSDLDDDHFAAHLAYRRLRQVRWLGLRPLYSASLVRADDDAVVVDLVGRAPRFRDADPHWRHRGVGIVRARISLAPVAGGPLREVLAPEVLWERSLSDVELQVSVSLGDQLAEVSARALGFRRLYPLGVGAVDRVRRPGEVSSLTPTTEDARLDKRRSFKVKNFPAHYRGEPYLPLNVARYWRRADGTVAKTYRVTGYAFHIWQPPRFARGFFSHGCVRMRLADVDELAAFVFGVEGTIPVVVRAAPFTHAAHPYPREAYRHNALVNYGTDEAPTYKTVNDVFVIDPGRGPAPDPDEVVGVTMDRPWPGDG